MFDTDVSFFRNDIAKELGVDCAVMLQNFYFWIKKNKANEKHFIDGRYWTYNSVKAFSILYPFYSTSQIRRILKKLIDKGIILKNNYNDNSCNHTSWYALSDVGLSMFQKQPIDLSKPTNRSDETDKSLTDNINIHIEDKELIAFEKGSPESDLSGNKFESSKKSIPYEEFMNVWNDETPSNIPKIKFLSPSRKAKVKCRIDEIGGPEQTMQILKQVCDKIKSTPFLQGQGNQNWKVNFDFVFANDKNWLKIIEENYGNKKDVRVSESDKAKEQRDREFFEHIKSKLTTESNKQEGGDDNLPF